MSLLNPEVTKLIESQNHPMEDVINSIRMLILTANSSLSENIKWNGPNYSFNEQDRFTLRTQPVNKLQLIFHRGAKVKAQPTERLIKDERGLLTWKENDRAIFEVESIEDVNNNKKYIQFLINEWVKVSKND